MTKEEMGFRIAEMEASAYLMEAHIVDLDYSGTINVNAMMNHMAALWTSIEEMKHYRNLSK